MRRMLLSTYSNPKDKPSPVFGGKSTHNSTRSFGDATVVQSKSHQFEAGSNGSGAIAQRLISKPIDSYLRHLRRPGTHILSIRTRDIKRLEEAHGSRRPDPQRPRDPAPAHVLISQMAHLFRFNLDVGPPNPTLHACIGCDHLGTSKNRSIVGSRALAE